MIIHMVGEGQTLWSIAQSYGVTVDEIRGLNAMPTESADIYPGQQLLIRMGITVTPALLNTTPAGSPQPQIETDIPVAITPEPTRTLIPSPSITALPVPSSTETPAGINLQNLPRGADLAGWIILTVGAIGLVLVILFGFRRSPK
jgi:LysM repeat protein